MNVPFQKVAPNHPVIFRTYRDAVNRFWIECHCNHCGQDWRKQCLNPARSSQWVMQFATIHGHGLRPHVNPEPVAHTYGATSTPGRGRW